MFILITSSTYVVLVSVRYRVCVRLSNREVSNFTEQPRAFDPSTNSQRNNRLPFPTSVAIAVRTSVVSIQFNHT